MSAKFTIGAFGIIFDEQGRVLLCHRRDIDVWNLPGGGMESGELPVEAVIREIKEETGLDAIVERLAGVYSKVDQDDLVFSFACRIVGGQLSVTTESSENRYFEPAHLPFNTSPRQVERIHDALRAECQPIFCLQTGLSTKEMLARYQESTGRSVTGIPQEVAQDGNQ
jgi:ADP-ribose pyrophosphatase YjhB (NUDIX family)